ncbi:hypothetical protein WH95_10150 [Kiloniella litopenaei]|uniref:Acetyltransferase n=1 Tax=Kiloniella litopenaei TaxID=1549748 RepID=A0A0M2R573_9PROT|nr:acyltransferase [Kiloniella litopenaei]KKJ77017.1 hypothetical protein WH95_10150 [Kiloniella litopenaei]
MTPEELKKISSLLYQRCEEELGDMFDRSLPFADSILRNRWGRAKRLGFGEGASIYDSAMVFGDVKVGEKTWIGPGTILDGTGGGLNIGSYCSIAAGVHLYTHDTVLWAVSLGKAPRRKAEISIGDGCHLGAQSIVLPGVTIGSQCVVAANSVVNKAIPPRTVVGGSPARVIGIIEGENEDIHIKIKTGVSLPEWEGDEG